MRKRIALLLVLFMIMVNFTGCTNKNSDIVKDNKQEEQEEENKNQEAEDFTEECYDKEIKEQRDKIMAQTENGSFKIGINKKPTADGDYLDVIKDISETFRGKNSKYVDLRNCDISGCDISNVKYFDFNTRTVWPENLPDGFNTQEILELNKNPGLNLRKLHDEGITGKGVNIAIIDYGLLANHQEFGDRVKYYDEVHYGSTLAQMHGLAVSSIAVGKNTGVAPEADLYFIATENYNMHGSESEIDFSWVALAIQRMLKVNEQLPEDDKIRVLSISTMCTPNLKGYDEFMEAINEAKAQNIFVASLNLFETYKYNFQGLAIERNADKSNIDNYSIIDWKDWCAAVSHIGDSDEYYAEKFKSEKPKDFLLIPVDAKTLASECGNEDYVFFEQGGWSWCVPYISGLYALCCQVNKDITPEEFWSKALETGDERQFENDGVSCTGKIVNPEKLIEAVKK